MKTKGGSKLHDQLFLGRGGTGGRGLAVKGVTILLLAPWWTQELADCHNLIPQCPGSSREGMRGPGSLESSIDRLRFLLELHYLVCAKISRPNTNHAQRKVTLV